MAELEKTIENKLIEQLTQGKSQWIYPTSAQKRIYGRIYA